MQKFKYLISGLPLKIKGKLTRKKKLNKKIKYVIEKEEWAIKNVGVELKNYILNNSNFSYSLTHHPYLFENQIIHFGSQYMWTNYYKYLSKHNSYVSSFFHGKHEDNIEVSNHINDFIRSQKHLSKIVTSSEIVKKRIIEYGIDENKVVKIGLGVDTKKFIPNIKINEIRKKLNINKKFFVVGSFQKDGIGWDQGDMPKLIKGPDLFISSLKKLKDKGIPIYVILLGPSRGYVKKNLNILNIEYHHEYLKDFRLLPHYYNLLDAYLVTSREEGGPLGLLEALSCGIPVISTSVGMAPEIISDKNKNGFISETKSDHICELLYYLFKNKDCINKIDCRNSVLQYDWSNLSSKYLDEVYLPLINKNEKI